MVYSVVQAAAHSSRAVRVESPAVLFPFHDGVANVIMMSNHDAFPFFRFWFTSLVALVYGGGEGLGYLLRFFGGVVEFWFGFFLCLCVLFLLGCCCDGCLYTTTSTGLCGLLFCWFCLCFRLLIDCVGCHMLLWS